jgi:hypothetical protein
MSTRDRYRELLQNVREAHRSFKKSFSEMGSWRSKDEKAVAKTKGLRDIFYKEAGVLNAILKPLTKRLLAGDEQVIDDVLEFLATDVPAFGSGYTKEKYYQKLKSFDLSRSQKENIKDIALQRCASTEYRREDSELRRLMIKIADLEFLEKVASVPARDGSRIAGHKERMIVTILDNRKDLREIIKGRGKEFES